MKLLLTSSGLTNKSISDALFDLVGKPAKETTIVFIPTAMNVGRGDKSWFIKDLNNILEQGFKFIDIVDISALPKEVWQPRIERGDVLFFSGGNTPHLMSCLKDSGLDKMLPQLLQTRVYVGVSAGSIVTNPTIATSSQEKKNYYKEVFNYENEEALSFVDFYIRPHFDPTSFSDTYQMQVEHIAKDSGKSVYVIDDQTALKVVDGTIEVISEGEYLKF